MIGYERVPGDRLCLVRGVPPRAVLTDAAVDFFLAATECRVIVSIVSKVEHSSPVEVYWMRRANAGDEQMCVDTITLSRRPLPPDVEKPSTLQGGEVDRHFSDFNPSVEKRGDSPYDNVSSTANNAKPQYGFLAQPYSAQSLQTLPSHTKAFQAETHLPKPMLSPVKQHNVTGQVVKSPVTNVGSVFQRGQPEALPPVYAAARGMPSAQPQDISYGQNQEVDELAALLKNVDPHVMENAAHRQQIMSKLENYSSSGSGSGMADSSPKVVRRHVQKAVADPARAGWHCRLCTYYNENANILCDMCQREKSDS